MKNQRLPFRIFDCIRIKSKLIALLTVAAFLHLSVSCSYYKSRSTRPSAENFSKQYQTAAVKDRYIILHQGTDSWHLSNVVLSEDKKELAGNLSTVDSRHEKYPLKYNQTSRRYKKSKVRKPLELHLFIKDPPEKDDLGKTVIPFDNIARMDVYEPDKVRQVMSIVGMTVGTIVGIAILIAALKGSCPFVYIKDGNAYAFAGELYPGAILPTLKRTDYLPLPGFRAVDDIYQLQITNELLEQQYTDAAQLLVVNHPESVEVMLDQNGLLRTMSKKENPTQAIADGIPTTIAAACQKDGITYGFDGADGGQSFNDIVFQFGNPSGSHHAKLILTAKNSLWFDLLYGKFNALFGSYFNQFQKQQRKIPAEKSMAWRNEQGIPLSVYVKSGNEWVLAEKINPVGPMAFRDLVIPIDLGKTPGKITEIKLETGYRFWEIDYAAMDFSNDISLDMETVAPLSAIDENGKNVTGTLEKIDNIYLAQREIGNEVTVNYRAKAAAPGQKQTVFLKNSGYYEYIRDYKGKPNIEKLKTFREKGALSRFSKSEYARFTETRNLTEIVFNHE